MPSDRPYSRVGRERDRLVHGGEPDDRGDRAEDLLGERAARRRRDVGQHGRPVEQPVVRAAGGELAPPAPTLAVHQPVDLVALAGVDERAERDLPGAGSPTGRWAAFAASRSTNSS